MQKQDRRFGRWRGEVDGKMCDPHGMLFSPQHQALLVGDGKNIQGVSPAPRGWFTSTNNTTGSGDGCHC